VIIYADMITKSIKESVLEIQRRRKYQLDYNKKHKIVAKTVYKPIREKIIEKEPIPALMDFDRIENIDSLTPYDKKKLVKKLECEMRNQAQNLNFEAAIKIREKVSQLKSL